MAEKWTQWKPIEGLASKYYVKSISDEIEGFKIILVPLKPNQSSIEILFKDGVDSYLRIDESFRQKLIHELDEEYGLDFYKHWTLFKVTNSRYLSWLSDQSYEWSNVYDFRHFSFLASDSTIDIVANYEPEVRFIE